MQPTKSAIGIVLDGNKVLLIKRSDVPVWVLPGGGVERGEPPESAVLREIYEETGLKAEVVRQVALYSPINKLAFPTYVYECRPLSKDISLSSESQAVGFFEVNRLPEPFFFLHADWIQDALQSHRDVIHKNLTQITYTKLLKYFIRHPVLVFRTVISRLGIPYNTR